MPLAAAAYFVTAGLIDPPRVSADADAGSLRVDIHADTGGLGQAWAKRSDAADDMRDLVIHPVQAPAGAYAVTADPRLPRHRGRGHFSDSFRSR